jgi:hypothetical protein
MNTYKIIRFHMEGPREIMSRGLTLEEAQEHCSDPETSSSTCSDATAAKHPGTWFDGYEED